MFNHSTLTTAKPLDIYSPLRDLVEKLISITTLADVSKVKTFLTGLLLPEANLLKAQSTTIPLVHKSNVTLGQLCEQLAALYYDLADNPLKKDLIQNAILQMEANRKNQPQSLQPSIVPDSKTLYVVKQSSPETSEEEEAEFKRLISPLALRYPDLFQNLVLYWDQMRTFYLNKHQADVYERKESEAIQKSLYLRAQEILDAINIITQSSAELNTVFRPLKRYLLDRALEFGGNVTGSLPHFQNIVAEYKRMLEKPATTTEVASLGDRLEILMAKINCDRGQNPDEVFKHIQEMMDIAEYKYGESFKNAAVAFRPLLSVFALKSQMLEGKRKDLNPDFIFFSPAERECFFYMIDLLRQTPKPILQQYLKITEVWETYNYMAHTLLDQHKLHMIVVDGWSKAIPPRPFLKPLLGAQQAMEMFALFVLNFYAASEGPIFFTTGLHQQMEKTFPAYARAKTAVDPFQLACLEYQQITERLRGIGHDPLPAVGMQAAARQQEEELEAFLQACEKEDELLRATLRQKKEQEKKNRKKSQTQKKKKISQGTDEKESAKSAPRTVLQFIDPLSPSGKLYLEAGELIRAKQHAEAISKYTAAAEGAMKSRDHVLVTAAILEVAECHLGEARKLLLDIQNTVLTADSENHESKGNLTTVCELYQAAAVVAEKSLAYCTDNILQDAARIPAEQLALIDHLTLSIKTVLNNANQKLTEAVAYIDSVEKKCDARLTKLAETRRVAMEKWGLSWFSNPFPHNRFRSTQVDWEKTKRRIREVREQIESSSQALQAPLQGFNYLHPPKVLLQLAAPVAETSTALALVSLNADSSLAFIERVKQMAEQRKSVSTGVSQASVHNLGLLSSTMQRVEEETQRSKADRGDVKKNESGCKIS